jgi:outer membrane lipoprotein carrier protein
MRMRSATSVILLATLLVAGLSAQEEGLCGRTLAQLSERYQRFQSMKAHFLHVLKAPALKQEEVEEGVLYLGRGGKMRWEYTRPEGKLAVSDGKNSFLYLPSEKQVYAQLVDKWESPFALRLLSGQARPEKEAICRGAESVGQRVLLKLDLKEQGTAVKDLEVVYDPQLGSVTAVRFKDPLGNQVSFELSEIRTDVPLPEGLFTFQVPEGAKLVGGE